VADRFLELVLVFSGVLIFRSLWTIMDSIPIFNETYMHLTFLVAGVVLSIFAVHGLSGKC